MIHDFIGDFLFVNFLEVVGGNQIIHKNNNDILMHSGMMTMTYIVFLMS